MSDADRQARAGDYVFGRMDDDERERAKRDLERDASFREAVVELAERVRLSGNHAETHAWDAVSAALSALPQMRPHNVERKPSPPVKSTAAAKPVMRGGMAKRDALHIGLILAGLAAAFALGYVVGISR